MTRGEVLRFSVAVAAGNAVSACFWLTGDGHLSWTRFLIGAVGLVSVSVGFPFIIDRTRGRN